MTKKPEITGNKQETKFKPGESGNPTGRPPGARNRATLAAEELLDGEAENLTRKAIELALAGDRQALRLCLDRILPPRRDRPVTIDLPPMANPSDAVKALAKILEDVASGNLTPTEAKELAGVVEALRKTLETEELERRIAILEGKRKSK